MKSERREQWAAVHKAADGTEHVAWARNEILARRLAALKGILAEAGRHAGDPMTSGEDEDADEGPEDPDPLGPDPLDRPPAHMVPAASARDAESSSEEHTSALQSPMRLPSAVSCLKNKHTTN